MRRFQVRSLDGNEGYEGEFDVIFHDDECGVVRYSDETYDSHKEALDVAERMEATEERPIEWDVCKIK